MTDRPGKTHTRSREVERRQSRRKFLYHVAPASAAAAAAVGITFAADQDAPEGERLTVLPGAGLVYNVRDYGARGDGRTDDAAAVQSAVNAASRKGGTVYFPAGTYAVSKTIVCDRNAESFTLCGAGGGLQAGSTPSVLLYTGAASGASGGLLTFNSSFGFEVCHLAFNYSNTAFHGDLINLDGAPHASDTATFHIHHCSSAAIATSPSARSILRLNKAIIGTISHCHLTGTAGNEIRIGDPGGSYVNAFQVEKCTFNYNTNAHILIGTGDGESIVIRDCTFEVGNAIRGATTAVDGADNALSSPLIEGCWFGDARAPVTWIDGLIAYTGTIRSCRFAITAGGSHLRLQGCWLVEANSFEYGTVYATTGTNLLALVAIANVYNNVTTLFNPTEFPQGSPTVYTSLGNVGADDVLAGPKLGLFATPPAAQPIPAGTISGFAPGTGGAVDSAATFTGGVGNSDYTIGDIVKALKQIGAVAA